MAKRKAPLAFRAVGFPIKMGYKATAMAVGLVPTVAKLGWAVGKRQYDRINDSWEVGGERMDPTYHWPGEEHNTPDQVPRSQVINVPSLQRGSRFWKILTFWVFFLPPKKGA